MKTIPKFKIYAGLSGGFGGARYCGVYKCADRDEAETYSREVAIEDYESYGGYHGLYTWDSMRKEIADDEYDGDIEQVDPEDVDMRMMEEVEGWLTYKVIPVQDNFFPLLIGLKMMMMMIPIVIVNNLSLPIL